MPEQSVKFTTMDDVGVITLNRPESRNALTGDMVSQMGRAIQACQRSTVRAVLLTGAGGAFCAGADVKVLADTLGSAGPDALSNMIAGLADALHKEVVLPLRRLNKPVVAAVNGAAAGAGFSLTLACDLRIAAQSARFLMAYANIGAPADGGSTYLLPRIVGVGRAMEFYLASQPIAASIAMEMGLVNQVLPDDQFERHAMETAVRLAQGPTAAYGRVKGLFERSWGSDLESQLDAETETFASIALTHDFQEGITAFTERRQARFQGK